MVIYLDVLLLTNLWVDYFLLRAVACWTHCVLRNRRACLAAGVGALGSLAIFLPPLPRSLCWLGRMALAGLLTRIAFGKLPLVALLRQTFWFLCGSFFFCGVISVLGTKLTRLRMVEGNTILYADLSLLPLLFAATAAAALVSLTERRNRLPAQSAFRLLVQVNDFSVRLPVLMDSGNGLTDLFSGKPVIVCPADAFAALQASEQNRQRVWQSLRGFRMIPVKTVIGEQLLPAFCPADLCLVREGQRIPVDAVLAITEHHTPAIVPTVFLANTISRKKRPIFH